MRGRACLGCEQKRHGHRLLLMLPVRTDFFSPPHVLTGFTIDYLRHRAVSVRDEQLMRFRVTSSDIGYCPFMTH